MDRNVDAAVEPTRQLVRLRGRSYLAFVFSPVVPIMEWLEDIDATLSRSPGFFVGKPVVLDLSTVDLSGSAISHLVMSLEKRAIRVLGIEGCEAARLTANMPPLLTGGRHAPIQQVEPEKPEVKPPPSSLTTDARTGVPLMTRRGRASRSAGTVRGPRGRSRARCRWP